MKIARLEKLHLFHLLGNTFSSTAHFGVGCEIRKPRQGWTERQR